MSTYGGREQQAECQRSGKKCRASELVRDGRNPQLLVLPEWADPEHPQEHPYSPDDQEGVAQFPIAPDTLPDPAFTLGGVYLQAQAKITLTWTQAQLLGPRADNYVLYRTTDGGAPVALQSFPVDYTNATGHVANIGLQKDYGHVYYVALTGSDSPLAVSHTYVYYVGAVDHIGDVVATTNIVTLVIAANGSGVLTPAPPGPPFSSVSLLMHMEGIEGGNVWPDSSSYAHTLTQVANLNFPVTAAARHIFGARSMSGDYAAGGGGGGGPYGNVRMPADAPLLFGSADFTIEFFVFGATFNAGLAAESIIRGAEGTTPGNPSYFSSASAFRTSWRVQIITSVGTPRIQFTLYDTGVPQFTLTTSSGALPLSANTHVAIVRSGSTFTIYMGGVAAASGTYAPAVFQGPGTPVVELASDENSAGLQNTIDEMRITKGYARYTGNFTPPSAAFPDG